MKFRCPLCEQVIESDMDIANGQHLICPWCEKKFTFYGGVVENPPSGQELVQSAIPKRRNWVKTVGIISLGVVLLLALSSVVLFHTMKKESISHEGNSKRDTKVYSKPLKNPQEKKHESSAGKEETKTDSNDSNTTHKKNLSNLGYVEVKGGKPFLIMKVGEKYEFFPGALEKKKSWESVVLPDGVTSIGDYAFYQCKSLKSIVIPSSVREIGECAFVKCSSLESVSIPVNVARIGRRAFDGCKSLSSVSFIDTDSRSRVNESALTVIGERAFGDCESLETFNIPLHVKEIGEHAFAGCVSLRSVNIPQSVKDIGESAFAKCGSLKSVVIPPQVKRIKESVFSECISLESVAIPLGVTRIEDLAFRECRRLRDIFIPSSVDYIGSSTFFKCASLETIYVEPGTTATIRQLFLDCDATPAGRTLQLRVKDTK